MAHLIQNHVVQPAGPRSALLVLRPAVFLVLGLAIAAGSPAQACVGLSPGPDGVLRLDRGGRGIAVPCAGRVVDRAMPPMSRFATVPASDGRDRQARKARALDAQASQPPVQDNPQVSNDTPRLKEETAWLKDQMARLSDETAKLRAETSRLKDQLARREAPTDPADVKGRAAPLSARDNAVLESSTSKVPAPGSDHAPGENEKIAPTGEREALLPDSHPHGETGAVARAWRQLRGVADRMKKDISGH